jgi:hypothetical protein
MTEEIMTPKQWLEQLDDLTNNIHINTWKEADRALWAAYELLGLSTSGHRVTYEELAQMRKVAITILEAFPEGLPTFIPG